MAEKERLIELLIKSEQNCFFCNRYENLDCVNECGMREKAKHLADYLIANGVKLNNTVSAVDAEPVVRCKDCIHHEDEIPGMVYCPHIVGSWVEDMFFCGNGAKMDEEVTT